MIGEIFNKIFYQPIFNLLILSVQFLPGHDFGIAIILLTLFVRLILHPLVSRSLKSQKDMADLQPKIQEIQKKYNGDKEKQVKETLKLWREKKVNPFSGLLFSLIQLPIMIALFFVLRSFGDGLSEGELKMLYPFLSKPASISLHFLGILDLSKSFRMIIDGETVYYWPVFPLIVLAIFLSFLQMRTVQPKMKTRVHSKDLSRSFQKPMAYFFIFFSFFILIQLPSAIALYWLVTSLYSLIQQKLILKT